MNICADCTLTAEEATISDYSFTVFNSIQQITEMYWNNHVPESNPLMQYEYLKLIESLHPSLQFRYVVVKKNETTLGVAYFQIVNFEGAQLLNYFPEIKEGDAFAWLMKLLKSLTAKILNTIHLRLLVAGNVFMTGEGGLYFSNTIDKATRSKLLRKMVRQIYTTDTAIKGALIADLYFPKTEFDNGFAQTGYHQLAVESDMSILIRPEWNSFDDYLHSLSSKYRVRTKKVLSLCEAHGVTPKDFSAEEIKLHEERLFELYQKVMSNADFKLAELSKGYFYQQKKLMPANYHVHGYFSNGNLIGFISVFHFGKRAEVHYTGMDAELCRPIHLYQHMMYDMVKFGIEKRVEKLHFGRTAPEIKSTIGATPSPMYGYLQHKNFLFNFFLVRTYTRNLKPQQYVLRSPFKYST